MSKARGGITDNILLLLKYQKQAITTALNGQYNQSNVKNNTLMLLPTALRKSWLYQLLAVVVSREIFIPDREFYCSFNHEFYSILFQIGNLRL